MPGTSPVALFVSPHLDDVAFSCGGTLARLRREGWVVALATVFTRSIPAPTGFALACQLDKGLAPGVDYLAIRRDEDAAFGRIVGVDRLDWLDLPEAPHRGYASAPELFAGVRPGDEAWRDAADRLAPLIRELDPAAVFAPMGVGDHVDHLHVIAALASIAGLAPKIAWYRDLPYAAKNPAALPSPDLPPGLVPIAIPLDPADLAAKLDGSAAYATQVPFQFVDEAGLRGLLTSFALAEGRTFGLDATPAEVVLAAPDLARILAERG